MEMIHVMTRHPESIRWDDTLETARQMMKAGGFRRLPVTRNGEVIGMVTERDLRQHTGYLESTKVNAAMSASVISVAPNSTVEEAARLMVKHKIGGLPVLENGKLVGIVTTIDMLRAFLEVVEEFHREHRAS
jgi:acetoin utilization protein AcuB